MTPTRAECIDASAEMFVEALAEMAETYAGGGAMAVAETAWLPGGPSRDELAARYERLAEKARAARAAANEAA